MMLAGMKNGLMRRGPRSLQQQGVFGDAVQAADARADQDAGRILLVLVLASSRNPSSASSAAAIP
jgi:hypothetical protein